MAATEFRSPTRVVFGANAIERVGDLAREYGASRVQLVSDPGLLATGIPERAQQIMERAQLEVFLFSGFAENPTAKMAENGAAAALDLDIDLLVGLGGGSSMDCAKAINFILTNGGQMRDYWGYAKALDPMLPMIAIPTTAGTGSEVQSYTLITDDETNAKMACGDPKAFFRVAILDPELTISQPRNVTANAGYDAIGHAVETYVTTKRTQDSLFFSGEAWKLLEANYLRVLDQPDDLEARGRMLLGSCWAGIAIENSMLGATHALANPLSERYNTTHGVAIAILLHHVVRWNTETMRDFYAELARMNEISPEDGLADRLEFLAKEGGFPRRLREIGVPAEDFSILADRALKEWTGTFNPRPLTKQDVLALYEAAF